MPDRQTVRSELHVRDISLETLEAGRGSPLLFLHGMAGAAASREAIALLGETHHVIAPSHPGYGASARPPGFDSIDDLAYLYLDVIERVAAEEGPVTVVGCSIGAWVAAEAAVRSQASVSALVLSTPLGIKVGGVLDRDILDLYSHSPEAIRGALYHDPEFGVIDFSAMADEELEQHFKNLESTAMYGWKPYMHNPKLLGRLGRITVPTLIVRGRSDTFLSESLPLAYRDAIPGAALCTVELAGHEPEREQPTQFTRVVSEFLSNVPVSQNV